MVLRFKQKRLSVFKTYSIRLCLLTSILSLLFCFPVQAAEKQNNSTETKKDSSVSAQVENNIQPIINFNEPGTVQTEDSTTTAEPGTVQTENSTATAEPDSVQTENSTATAEPDSVQTEEGTTTAEPGTVQTKEGTTLAEPGTVQTKEGTTPAKPGTVQMENKTNLADVEQGKDPSAKQSEPKNELEETKQPTKQEIAGGSYVQILTKQDIKNTGAKSVLEVLRTVPGINIGVTGIKRSAPAYMNTDLMKSINMNGFEDTDTLVLVDGFVYNDVNNHNTNLDEILVDTIERIEIIHGSQSILYGSNAVAGVINIITNQPSKKLYDISSGLEVGSYQSWKSYFSTTGTIDELQYAFDVNIAGSAGYSMASNANPHIIHGRHTNEKDGWKKINEHLMLRYYAAKNVSFFVTQHLFQSSTDYDEITDTNVIDTTGSLIPVSFLVDSKNDQAKKDRRINIQRTFVSGGTDVEVAHKAVKVHLAYQKMDSENNQYDNNNKKDEKASSKTTNRKLILQSKIHVANQFITIGDSHYTEHLKSKLTGIQKAYTQTANALWLQDQLFAANNSISILSGVRYDKYSSFGSAVTYRITPSFRIDKTGTTLRTAYGTGFKAPSLFQLSDSKDEKLKPEKSKTFDIGMEQVLFSPYFKIGGTYFNYQVNDLIAYDSTKFDNTKNKTKSNGYIGDVSYTIPFKYGVDLNYIYTEAKDANGERVLHIPETKIISQGYLYLTPNIHTHMSVIYESRRAAGLNNSKEKVYLLDKSSQIVNSLDSYILINANIQYTITKNWNVYGQVENAGNVIYEDMWSYARPRRSFYFGTNVSF